ncbi:GGDEF domain-containing protein [Desulfocicer niacini]
MIELDPRTVIFINFIYSAFIAFFLIAAWRLSKVEFPGLGNWVIGFGLLALNFFVLSFRGIIPQYIVMVLPHMLVCWAYIEIKRGLSKFYKFPNWVIIDYIVMIIFSCALIYCLSNSKFRIVTVTFFPTLIMIITMIQILYSTIEDKKLFIILFSIACFIQFIRMIFGLMWEPSVNPMKTGNNLSTISILFFMTNIVIFFTLLFVVIQRIINLKNQLLVDLEKAATIDELTQLNNRRGFMNFVNLEISRLKRSRSDYAIGLGDLDNFKNVNDTYGHDVGDAILRQVAQILKKHIRESDVVARWGGEEFIFMFTGSTLKNVVKVLNRIRQAIEEHQFVHETIRINQTVSFGISYIYDSEYNIEKMIKMADENLYEAKQQGRNKVIYKTIRSN